MLLHCYYIVMITRLSQGCSISLFFLPLWSSGRRLSKAALWWSCKRCYTNKSDSIWPLEYGHWYLESCWLLCITGWDGLRERAMRSSPVVRIIKLALRLQLHFNFSFTTNGKWIWDRVFEQPLPPPPNHTRITHTHWRHDRFHFTVTWIPRCVTSVSIRLFPSRVSCPRLFPVECLNSAADTPRHCYTSTLLLLIFHSRLRRSFRLIVPGRFFGERFSVVVMTSLLSFLTS